MDSSSDCGTKAEMRAVLVKVGALLAPDYFMVALGDKQMESPAHQAAGEVAIGGESDGRVEGEGGEKNEVEDENRNDEKSEQQQSLAVESTLSVGSDSEYSGITTLKEEEGAREGEEETKKGGEKWYEMTKEQVQAYKENTAMDDAADRSAHTQLSLHRAAPNV